MPELPEVETVRRGLRPVMEGAVIERMEQRRADLRFALPAKFSSDLTGRTVIALTRRAKYLLAHLDDTKVLIMHLGMSGRFSVTHNGDKSTPGRFHKNVDDTREHIVFHMSGGVRIGYSDPRRFGIMDLAARDEIAAHRLLARLGPEPLSADFAPAYLNRALRHKRASIKSALLDQRIVAGLGNIYVCEALFRARVNPHREAASLTAQRRPGRAIERLVTNAKAVLQQAIEAGGSSLRDHAATDGTLGYFQHSFSVYDRENAPCPRPDCSGRVIRAVQSGRSSFYCPRCQR